MVNITPFSLLIALAYLRNFCWQLGTHQWLNGSFVNRKHND
uniref:Uncharacterized protein n=1 Tax=Rhizophora mucronata TaxID=61149 RepID=A0A2P2N0Y4_RHIMU